ncbi:MAG: 1-acyl-sn-glycerol-3-phosphate acyltransferase [Planctomycetia bacterium]|nr:1-acyl-sn-glycerol-3-phosphate acyltransferase [Planctomycetia bacterium]
MHEVSLAKRLWYENLRVICRLAAAGFFHLRCTGRENQPRAGGALVLSNHQSHLDPVLVGMAFDRRMNYLARETLFDFAPFRWLIQSLDAIPIDRDGLGLSGLKETLRRLKHEELVLIFPEGTRTSNGEVAPLKPGFSALAKRARVPLLPVGIDGAFDAWPRRHPYPGLATIHLHIGEPISPQEAQAADERQLVAEVERRIRDCHEIARRGRRRAIGLPPVEHRPAPAESGPRLSAHVA